MSTMSTADLLVEQMFSWIDQRERCAEQLRKLARELESISRDCVSSSMSVATAGALMGSLGSGALLYGLAVGVWSGAGLTVSVATKTIEDFLSSDTMKEAQETEKKSNRIAEEIQKQFQRLKAEVTEVSSLTDPDEVERRVMAEILRAVARRYGVNLQINDHMFSDDQFFQQRNMGLNLLKPLLLPTLLGILGFFALKFNGKKTQLLLAEGVKQLIKELSSAGVKTAFKGGAMVVGGAVGLAFALSESIDNWKDLIKKNHVTKASQSLRDTADEILHTCRTLRKQFDDMKRMLVDMERLQQERERQERERREREERERREREEKERRERQEKERLQQERERQERERRERQERERLQRKRKRQEKERRERQERERLQREREREERERRERQERERLQRECERQKNPAQERSGDQRTEQKGSEQETENQLNKQTGSDQQGWGDQADEERDDGDEERDSEEETEEDEGQQMDRRKRRKYNRKKETQSKQRGRKESADVVTQVQKKNSNIIKEGNPESDNNQRPPASIKVGLLNVRSMNNKTTKIKELITENNLDVLATTETWLKRNKAGILRQASPENFSSCHSSRKRRGGGVAIQFSNELWSEQMNFNTNIRRSEYTAVALRHHEWNQPIPFINFYFPPGYTREEFRAFLDDFQQLLDEVNERFNSIIVTGDFNIQVDNQMRTFTDEFDFLLALNGLDQHVREPTHRGGHTLDLVISRNVDITSVSVRNDGISDHYTVYFDVRPKDMRDKDEGEN